jgi:diguanylate cyclase (GGDEF)-like protein/PAS domain S-box-containing protein
MTENSEEFWSQLLSDCSHLGSKLLCLGADGAVLNVNRAFAEFVGIDPGAAQKPWVWSALLAAPCHPGWMAQLAQQKSFTAALQFKSTPLFDQGAWLDGTAQWLPQRQQYVCVLHDVTARVLAQQQAQQRVDQFELLAGHVNMLLAYFDIATWQCTFANQRYAAAFGLTQASVVGRTMFEIVGQTAALEVQGHVDRMVRSKCVTTYVREAVAVDGSSLWLDVQMLPQLNARGEVVAALALIADITAQRVAELALHESQDRLDKFMQASAEGIAFHRGGKIVDANPAACDLIGYSLSEMTQRRYLDFVSSEHQALISQAIRTREDFVLEACLIHKNGHRVPVELMGRSMLHGAERVRMSIIRDVSERHQAQAQIRNIALHDSLTGLPNRLRLAEEMGHAIAHARRNDAQFALMFMDLDHFSRVNDSLGHLVGDNLLQTIARRITDVLRTHDLVARFGGDEFIVMLPHLLQREDAEHVANKLLASIAQPLDIDGRMISITASIGISLFPHDADNADALIKNADTAMYMAKSQGRANFQFFSATMASSAFDALVMESQLTQGLERGEFVLHFQPQVRAQDGVLVGAEALLRWNHPEKGLLFPDKFIELAEQQRLMLPLGTWVLREAIQCARRWSALGWDMRVAVNLSMLQFQSDDFVPTVIRLLEEERVPARLLELELTERMLLDETSGVRHKIKQLKAMGIRIAMDDFGTGYSSLSQLKDLPIDKMKIDRSFVQDLPENQDAAAIARAIVQMSSSMGLPVIAEGVETVAQRQFLTQLGVSDLQGLLISPPLSTADFDGWMRERKGM